MPKLLALALSGALVCTGTLSAGADRVLAQATPSLPGTPQPTSRMPLGAQGGGSGSYVVSAAANEHASFFWVLDSIQHVVTLCEKADGKDFVCTAARAWLDGCKDYPRTS